MQKTQVIAHFLIPPNQHAPKPVHPTMSALYDPPPSFELRLLLQGLGLFTSRTDVGREAKLDQEVPHLLIVVAFVQAHPLGSVGARIGPLDRDALDGLACQLEIIAIGAVYCEADRHPIPVGEDAALGPDLAAVRGVLAHLFPPQGELGSSPHPSQAMPSQSLAERHIPRGPVPTTPRRRRPPSTLGNGDGQHCASRAPWRPEHPTGSRYAGRRRWHPWPCDHRHGADGTPKGAVSVVEARGRCAPTTRLGYASHSGFSRGRQASASLLAERIFPQRIP